MPMYDIFIETWILFYFTLLNLCLKIVGDISNVGKYKNLHIWPTLYYNLCVLMQFDLIFKMEPFPKPDKEIGC